MAFEPAQFKVGDLVRVRSRDEILASLDDKGCLEGMPFMPEMLQHCGRIFKVTKSAHKTCDTKCKTGGRSIPNCVHLANLRCNGSAHGGCQARCFLFWKTEWLEKVAGPPTIGKTAGRGESDAAALEGTVRVPGATPVRYRCQATEIVEASRLLSWWDPRQYVKDVTTGNQSAGAVVKILLLAWAGVWRSYAYPARLSYWFYDRIHRLLLGRPSPYAVDESPSPLEEPGKPLHLMPGERVRVKPIEEIRKTLDRNGKHKGLSFDPEMSGYCGGEFVVALRVEQIINERTGEMMQMKRPCIMLEGVVCKAEYSDRRLFCPRAIPPYWREHWLERVSNDARVEIPKAELVSPGVGA